MPTNTLSVEEGLRRAQDRAAMLRFLTDAAASAKADRVPDPEVFSGIADAFGEIEEILRSTRNALDAEALDAKLKPVR